MKKTEKTLVFGHKKPDTDSITGSISLAYLKNQLGIKAEARVLGSPNNETKFVLDYFNTPCPKYLNDVKVKVKNLNRMTDYFSRNIDSIYEGLNNMNEHVIGTLPILDKDNNFLGLVSLKDIARYQFNGDISKLYTSYDNIINTLDAKELLRFDEEIDGKIIVASYRSTTFIETVDIEPNTVLIVGDRHSIIEHAIEKKAKMLILTGDTVIKEKHLELAKKNKVNIIITFDDTFSTSRKIGMANYLDNILIHDDVLSIDINSDLNDFIDITKREKFSSYPILDENKNYMGLIRLSDITEKPKRKIILVDHNEASQSVDGLEEAELIEVVDHHKIGTIGTSMPISFRNMPVGSSNTIIALLYKENNIKIPKDIAGLMISGIISDTLLFRSPTTTEIDKQVASELAEIACVDIEKYGMEMLKAGSSLKGKTKEEILYSDFKNFTIDGKKVGIGQITTLNIDEIMNEKDEYVKLINDVAMHNEYYLVALFATDIITNGSYMFYNDSAKEVLDNCFNAQDLDQGYYLAGVVSRKKQIIPNIMHVMEKK